MQLNKQRYVEQFRKNLGEDSSKYTSSSSEYTSANEDPDVDIKPINDTQMHIGKDLGRTSVSNEMDFFSLNEDNRDSFFSPKSSRPSPKVHAKSKINETILATAAFNAATEPVDVQNEIRWFEGELVETTPFEVTNNGNKTNLVNSHDEECNKEARRPSNASLSSTSTIDSLPNDSKSVMSQGNKDDLSEHEKKKKIGHYRSKSDQFRRFRPFGTNKPNNERASLNGDGDSFSSSLPTNSDVTGKFYFFVFLHMISIARKIMWGKYEEMATNKEGERMRRRVHV